MGMANTRWNSAWCCRMAGCVGSSRAVKSNSTAVANRFRVRGVSMDITTRKQAEADVSQQRAETGALDPRDHAGGIVRLDGS